MKKFATLFLLIFSMNWAFSQSTEQFLKGQFIPSENPFFVKIDTAFCDQDSMFIQLATYNAFLLMREAALSDGIDLFIVSATRNFFRQREIWENKWRRFRGTRRDRACQILAYSSMPGTSRHHWGTDIDLCSTENKDWDSPELAKTLEWLKNNAARFGFYMPYTDDFTRSGYCYEPWHWSYFPYSAIYTETYKNLIEDAKIDGFIGADMAPELLIVRDYVLGIATPPASPRAEIIPFITK